MPGISWVVNPVAATSWAPLVVARLGLAAFHPFVSYRPAPQPAVGGATRPITAFAPAQMRPDGLAGQQAIYEELLTSQEWARPARRGRCLTRHEITRDLAGWSLPTPETRGR